MRGVDYARRLAAKRLEYKDAKRQLEKQHEREMTRREAANAKAQQNSFQNFSKEKQRIEGAYDKGMDRMGRRLLQDTRTIKDQYDREVEQLRKQVRESHLSEKDQHTRQREHLQQSFRRAGQAERRQHRDIQQSAMDRHQKQLQEVGQQHHREVKQMDQKSKQADLKAREVMRNRSRELQDKHQSTVENLRSETTQKNLADAKNRGEAYQRLQKTHEAEKEIMQANQQALVEGLKSDSKLQISRLDDTYKDILKNQRKEHMIQRENLVRDGESKKFNTERERLHDSEILRQRHLDYVKEKENPEVANKFENTQRQIFEKKLNDYKDMAQENRRNFENRGEISRQEYMANIKNQKNEAGKFRAEREKEIGKYLGDIQTRNRKEREKIGREFSTREKSLLKIKNRQIADTEEKWSEKKEQAVNELKNQLNSIVYKNTEEIKRMRDRFGQERLKLTLNKESSLNDLRGELGEKHQKTLMETQKSFDSRLKNMKNRANQNETDYTRIVRNLKDKNVKDNQYKDFLLWEKHQEDLAKHKEQLRTQNLKSLKRLMAVKKNYDRWINEIRFKSDKKLKQVIDRHRDETQQNTINNLHSLKRLERLHQREQLRMKEDYELKLGAVVAKYEDKLKLQKENFQEQLAKLRMRTV